MITIMGVAASIKKFKNLTSSREVSTPDRCNFTFPLPSAGLESFTYPKEEIRLNKENNISVFIQNTDKAEKTWINRLFVSRRGLGLPLFMSKSISLN